MISAPSFKKVILLLHTEKKSGGSMKANKKKVHDDCSMIMTGNYIIITEQETGDAEQPTSTTGVVYPISDVISYKIINN